MVAMSDGARERSATEAERAEAADAEAFAAGLDRLLDESLEGTFPASDPISVVLPQPKPAGQS